MNDVDLYEWVEEVRRHTLTEEHGPEEAERLMRYGRSLVPPPPETRHPGSATSVDADWQQWDDVREDSTLLRRRTADGVGHRPRTDEQRARNVGLSVEQWRKLSR